MRVLTLFIITLAFGPAACGADKDETSTALTTPSTTSGTTTAGPTTDAITMDEPTTGSSTTGPGSTTAEPGSTTDLGSTTEPSSTTDAATTTGGGGGTDVPYVDCSNDMMNPILCPDGLMCVDGFNTNGLFFGSFCSPPCSVPDMICPNPEGATGVYAMCMLGMGMPTNCVLTCSLANDTCPAGMACEDVGFADGICTHP